MEHLLLGDTMQVSEEAFALLAGSALPGTRRQGTESAGKFIQLRAEGLATEHADAHGGSAQPVQPLAQSALAGSSVAQPCGAVGSIRNTASAEGRDASGAQGVQALQQITGTLHAMAAQVHSTRVAQQAMSGQHATGPSCDNRVAAAALAADDRDSSVHSSMHHMCVLLVLP